MGTGRGWWVLEEQDQKRREQLALALWTCSQWWSDHEGGIGLLSLGTTGKIWSETHRERLLGEIDDDLRWCRVHGDPEEIPRLEGLRGEVLRATLGEEWLSWGVYSEVVEGLYQRGLLGPGWTPGAERTGKARPVGVSG
jgi:hypothetical protein